MKYIIFMLLFISLDCVYSHSKDFIEDLPGLTFNITFKHYSGYLNGVGIDRLHYWFVESQNNPAKDPVLLWMNGGPGCSSMDGLLNELGPYLITEDGKRLLKNNYSWNKFANVMFLEAPVCVGFSYREGNDTDCVSSDDSTAASNYEAMIHFFKKFPQFQDNPLYITGESYAGVYVPTLTLLIAKGKKENKMNLKGFAIGNGLSSYELNDKSLYFFSYYHGLIGDDLWDKMVNNCCGSGKPTQESCRFQKSIWPECEKAVNIANSIIYNENINIYNLYGKCLHPPQFAQNTTSRYSVDKSHLYSRGIGPKLLAKGLAKFKLDPPCTYGGNMRKYLNNKRVQKAIHIKNDNAPSWDICNDEVVSFYKRQYTTMFDQYIELNKLDVKGLVYNGDVDMACNFLGDEWFTESLGLELVKSRSMWFFDKQVGGFVKRFKNLDVLTVRGSGHMVPQDKPGPAYKMMISFVNGKDY